MLIKRRVQDRIVGVINGTPFNTPYSEENSKELTAIDADFSKEKLEEFLVKANKVYNATKLNFLEYNPVSKGYRVTGTEITLSEEMGKALEELIDDGTDTAPMEKFWIRVISNPRVNAEMIDYFYTYITNTWVDMESANKLMDEGFTSDEARNMSTFQDISITQEGLLATYKVVDLVDWKYEIIEDEENPGNYIKVKNPKYATLPGAVDEVTGEVLVEDALDLPKVSEELVFTPAICRNGDLFFSGSKLGYTYRVGEVQYLPEKALRNLNNTFGGGGLYIGGLQYIESYRRDNNNTLLCFVNPSDVLSFQDQGSALRTDALFPYAIADIDDVKNSGTYHSSDYVASSEDRIESIIKKLGDSNYTKVQDAINESHERITRANSDS